MLWGVSCVIHAVGCVMCDIHIYISIIGSIVDDEEAVLEEEVEEQRQDHYALLVRAWEAKVSPC